MQNKFISVKGFKNTCTIYSVSKPIEILWVVTQKMSLIHFLIQF